MISFHLLKSQISSNDCSFFPALNGRWLKSSSPPSLSQLTYPNSSQMTRSYFSNLNCSVLSVFADLASLIWVSRTGTEVNNTVKSCWQAFIPQSRNNMRLSVPGFPYRTRFLPCLMKSSVSNSGNITCASLGMSSITSSCRYFICGNPQILSLIFFYTPFSWRFPFQAIPSRTADGSSFLQLPMKGCIQFLFKGQKLQFCSIVINGFFFLISYIINLNGWYYIMHFIVSCHERRDAFKHIHSFSFYILLLCRENRRFHGFFCLSLYATMQHGLYLVGDIFLTPRPVSSLHAVTMSVRKIHFSGIVNNRTNVLLSSLKWMSYSLLSSSGALCQTTEWGNAPGLQGKCTQIVLQRCTGLHRNNCVDEEPLSPSRTG